MRSHGLSCANNPFPPHSLLSFSLRHALFSRTAREAPYNMGRQRQESRTRSGRRGRRTQVAGRGTRRATESCERCRCERCGAEEGSARQESRRGTRCAGSRTQEQDTRVRARDECLALDLSDDVSLADEGRAVEWRGRSRRRMRADQRRLRRMRSGREDEGLTYKSSVS